LDVDSVETAAWRADAKRRAPRVAQVFMGWEEVRGSNGISDGLPRGFGRR
jgi:hypothetical protein